MRTTFSEILRIGSPKFAALAPPLLRLSADPVRSPPIDRALLAATLLSPFAPNVVAQAATPAPALRKPLIAVRPRPARWRCRHARAVGLPQRSRLFQPDARRQRRDESAVKVLRAILREL